MIQALSNIMGGNDNSVMTDAYGGSAAITQSNRPYNPFPNGMDGGYVPPVQPNPLFIEPSLEYDIMSGVIKISLNSSETCEFFENDNSLGVSTGTTKIFSPSTTFSENKKYEAKKDGVLANEWYWFAVKRMFDGQNSHVESLNKVTYTLQSDGSYQISDSTTLSSTDAIVDLEFTFTQATTSPVSAPEQRIQKIQQVDATTYKEINYQITFGSNFNDTLQNNVFLDYTVFGLNGDVLDTDSIRLGSSAVDKSLPLSSLNGNVAFSLRYENFPTDYRIINLYQTSVPSLVTADPDFSKWDKQPTSFSVPAKQLQTGISVATFFEKDVIVDAPTLTVAQSQIGVHVKDSDDDKNVSIPFSTTHTDTVSVYVPGFADVISIPATDGVVKLEFKKHFSKVYGVKKIVLVPESTQYGTGSKVEVLITFTAVNDFPSITQIVFAESVDVPSFSDYNIDLTFAYTSFSVTSVDVHLLQKDNSFVPLYKDRQANGDITINLKSLRDSYPNWAGSSSVTLKFIPYNSSGVDKLEGNPYTVTTKLTVPTIQLDENIFSSLLFNSFKNVIKLIEPEKESKYLTHLANFGNNEQVLISSWDSDNWTLSNKITDELGNLVLDKNNTVDALILKLYTPLPADISENSTFWVTKLMANPLVTTVILTDQSNVLCPPLKGPNFNIAVDHITGQSTNFESLDTLILSGSTSSNELIATYINGSAIDTTDLNIQYGSGSVLQSEAIIWNNFVHFSSATERFQNFVYKVQLIEKYEELIVNATTDVTNTGFINSVASKQEVERQTTKKNQIIQSFDGFENFLYTSSSLSWPYNGTTRRLSTTTQVGSWYTIVSDSATQYDRFNQNCVTNNIPQYIINNTENDSLVLFFTMVGQHFDVLYYHTKAIERSRGLGYKSTNGISDKILYDILKSFGWDAKNLAVDEKLWKYVFGVNIDGDVQETNPAKKRTADVWRRIINNLPYLLKHKGTRRGIYAIMACYGIPSSNLSILEFGGPEVTDTNKSKLVMDNLTTALKMTPTTKVELSWTNTELNKKPDTIELFVKPAYSGQWDVITGDNWGVKISGSTNSDYGRVILDYGADQITTSLLPIFNDRFFGIEVSRTSGSISSSFELNVRQADKERTIFVESVSQSVLNTSASWDSGTNIYIGSGSNGYSGSVDEFRLWSTPLDKERFYEHVSFPEMINGNHVSASTDDLYLRLDFEYPKNLYQSASLINVDSNIYFSGSLTRNDYEDGNSSPIYSINPSASFSASVYGFTNVTTYPYQFEVVDRSVVLEIPDVGISRYATNKVRFESQYRIDNGNEISGSVGVTLSPDTRSTKKAFDQSPIDSNRVGLFFSPTKELNIDIAKSFGGINLDNYIGDPSDVYNDNYKQLDTLRNYYFQRFNDRDIYQYINLIKLYEKSMFDDIKKMLPGRTKATVGLLIEPHILERSKYRHKRPVAENEQLSSEIHYSDTTLVVMENEQYDTTINTQSEYYLTGLNEQYEAVIDESKIIDIIGENEQYDGLIADDTQLILESDIYSQNTDIDCGLGNPTILTEIDIIKGSTIAGQSDLDRLGFGIYGQNGNAIRTYYNADGTLIKERVLVQIIKETKSHRYTYLTGSVGNRVYEAEGTQSYVETRFNIQPFSGSTAPTSTATIEVTPLNGYALTHFRNTSDLTRGLENSFFRGCKNTAATTLDGTSPVEVFATNPNTLRVNKAGRDVSEPILEVE
jgi:hypothetical protein